MSFREMKAVEAPTVIEQRLQAGVAAAIGGFDPADEDRVMAARIGVDDRTFELGQRVLEDGQAEGALAVGGALELLGAPPSFCEAAGQVLVVRVQDIDRKSAVRAKGRVALRRVGHADQNE